MNGKSVLQWLFALSYVFLMVLLMMASWRLTVVNDVMDKDGSVSFVKDELESRISSLSKYMEERDVRIADLERQKLEMEGQLKSKLELVKGAKSAERVESVESVSDSIADELVLLRKTKTNPSFSALLWHPNKDFVSRKVLKYGLYELDTTRFIEYALPFVMDKSEDKSEDTSEDKSRIAIDLGANMGFYSLTMAHRGAHVLSFEPSPDSARLVRYNAQLNGFFVSDTLSDKDTWWNHVRRSPRHSSGGSIHLIQAAASNSTGEGTLSRHQGSTGLTTLGNPQRMPFPLAPLQGHDAHHNISLRRLDQVLAQLGVTPTDKHALQLLKVDVEGYELFALQGLDLTQYPFRYLTLEFFPALLKGCGLADPVDLLLYLHRNGYRFLQPKPHTANHFIPHQDIPNQQKHEADIRRWGNLMVRTSGDNDHVNIFAELRSSNH